MFKISLRQKGKKAEELAIKYLKNKGYEIVSKNFYTRWGEIDLIAKKKNLLIFVEVKSQSGEKEYFPEEKVDFNKQKKILKTAEIFLLKNSKNLIKIKEIRLDVIVINLSTEEIRHYEGAFFKEKF